MILDIKHFVVNKLLVDIKIYSASKYLVESMGMLAYLTYLLDLTNYEKLDYTSKTNKELLKCE